jgi:hypothetical protein
MQQVQPRTHQVRGRGLEGWLEDDLIQQSIQLLVDCLDLLRQPLTADLGWESTHGGLSKDKRKKAPIAGG